MKSTLVSSYYYWFNSRPELLSLKMVILLVLLGFIAMAAFIYLYKKNKQSSSYKKILVKLENYALGNWVVLWIMAFFYQTGTPFLSAKFWMLLWLVISTCWAIYIYIYFKKHLAYLEIARKINANDKYIPKKAS